jgi:hypothetical protein
MTREQTIEQLEALSQGIHPGTGEIVEPASPLNDPTLRRILFAAVVLLKDGRFGRGGGPKVPLAERNRALGKPLRSSAPWDQEEERALETRLVAGAGLREIAKELARTPGALVSRLERLGVLDPSERLLGYDDIAARAREHLQEGETADGEQTAAVV